MPAAKQVVYVDVDDEITGIIDKINGADAKVIALVLPKRAAVFQSIVNMKLLKRRAEQAGKHLVLITSEAGLMPLAGMAGVYVAQTLQSKPAVPSAPVDSDLPDDLDDEPVSLDSRPDDFNARNAAAPVGALAAGAGAGVNDLPDDVVELDKAAPAGKPNGRPSPAMAAVAAGAAAKGAGKGKDKNLSVPNFMRFRKRLIFAALGLFLLIGLWYVAAFVMPTAQVTIKTKTTDIDTELDVTLDTEATTVDIKTNTIPAKTQQQQKNNTQQAPATGTENKGEKASGSVTLTNCSKDNKSVTVPAGTAVSANGQNYLTQSTATMPTSAPDSSGNCRDLGSATSQTVNVLAQKPGAAGNIGASTFSVAGFSEVQAKSSSAMSGGTDNNVKIVQQADIDGAKAKLASAAEKDTAKKALQKTLEDNGLFAIQSSFHVAGGNTVTSVKVGDEAEAVTVSETVTYTMYGTARKDLRKLIESAAEDKIDRSKQSLIDDGIGNARFGVETTGAEPTLKVTLTTTAVAGPQIDAEAVKRDIVGKKSGEVKDQLMTNPGVEDVVVKYSPFWVTKAPKVEKTIVTFEKTGGSAGTTKDTDTTQPTDAADER